MCGGTGLRLAHAVLRRRSAWKLPPIVTVGPSGVGKSSIIRRVIAAHPERFQFCCSHTTRAPRKGEEHGVHYHFVPRSDMESSIAKGRFLEWADVHGHLYGTSLDPIEEAIERGRVPILDKDVQGVRTLRDTGLPFRVVFIRPPSHAVLESRLRARGTETEEDIQRRLHNAQRELDFLLRNPSYYDHALVNDQLDVAVEEMLQLLRRWRAIV